MNVYVVTMSGEEWEKVVSVFHDKKKAEKEAAYLNRVKHQQQDEILRLANFHVEAHPIKDTRG